MRQALAQPSARSINRSSSGCNSIRASASLLPACLRPSAVHHRPSSQPAQLKSPSLWASDLRAAALNKPSAYYSQRQRVIPRALPPLSSELVALGGATLVGLLGVIAYQVNQSAQQGAMGGLVPSLGQQTGTELEGEGARPPPPRKDAVLVLGATGRVGRQVVQKLLAAGRTVVAGVRSADKAASTFGPLGIAVEGGYQESGSGVLFVEADVDVTSADSIGQERLWQGVTQVVNVLGPVFGPQPGGGFGILDNMSSERVEAQGAGNLVAAATRHLQKQELSTRTVLPMRTAEDLAAWQKLDDVIMGGNSSSGLEPIPSVEGVAGTLWKGTLIVEGGGFCGTRSSKQEVDLSDADGVHMRVKGDGSIFKLNIKTTDQEDTPESTYQATFDTVPDTWSDVYLPWHNFVPVKRAQSDPAGEPLNPAKISKWGLVLSRFEFNKMPNPVYKPGPFELRIADGLGVFTAPKPQLVQISSAGVERNAIIGNDEARRKKDIPIVQLNPGGTLNHKYTAEIAVRSSGYPYTVLRCTGMVDKTEGGPFLLEADQGDAIVGEIGRDEVAQTVVAILSAPDAVGKTFELRRGEAADQRGNRGMESKDFLRLFLRQSLDRNRWRVGLQPFPLAVPPPPPPTEDRTKEILADVAKIREVKPATSDAANGSSSNGNGSSPAEGKKKELVGAGSKQ